MMNLSFGETHFPVSEELVAGKLNVTIRLHEVEHGAIPCWIYVTDGLARHKQREIAFTLVRKQGESPKDYPREPLEFFRKLFELLKEGAIVDAGAFASLGGPGLLGFQGVLYFDPAAANDSGLAMVGLTKDEVEMTRAFGAQRVLSLLAKATRFFPAPYWTERGRASRVRMGDIEQSVLNKVTRISQTGFSVFREAGRLVLRAREGTAAESVRQSLRSLAMDHSVALLTELHPSADGELSWEPGQHGARAATQPGSKAERLGGSFVIFVAEQAEDGAQLVEDGYALSLTRQSWARLREAILDGKELMMAVCELGWIPEAVPFKRWGKSWPVGESCRVRRVLLKQPEAQTAEAINMESLLGFVTAIELAVREVFLTRSAQGGVRVDVEAEPRNLRFQISRIGAVEDEAMRQIWEELQLLGGLGVTAKIGIAVEFEVKEKGMEAAI